MHAGKEDQGGPSLVTECCIRTTDDGMQQIHQTHQTDPLTEITVQE